MLYKFEILQWLLYFKTLLRALMSLAGWNNKGHCVKLLLGKIYSLILTMCHVLQLPARLLRPFGIESAVEQVELPLQICATSAFRILK